MRAAGLRVALLLAGSLWGTARAESTAPGGLRGSLHVRSADTAGRGVVETGIFSTGYARDDTSGARHYFSITSLQLGIGIGRQLELGAALPVRWWFATGTAAERLDPAAQAGFGDLVASTKLRVPLPWSTLRLGMLGGASFPTGSRSRGMSSQSTDLEFLGLLTLDLTRLDRFVPTRLHVNAGYRWNRNETSGVGLAPLGEAGSGGFWPPAYPPVPRGDGPGYNDPFLWRAGIEFVTRDLSLFTEFALDDFRHVRDKGWRDNPMSLTEGAVLELRNGWRVKGAVDVSLQADDPPATMPAQPDWRFTLGVTWRWAFTLGDRDGDGVPDKRDACPGDAEDPDGYQDADGCPDLDNDADGVPDRADLAPDLGEDRDGFQDEDGRPDLDNDGDGIRDTDDACPNDPEDYDGDRDTDGCPDKAQPPAAAQPPSPSPPPASTAAPPTPAP